jgi:hypothetical protein
MIDAKFITKNVKVMSVFPAGKDRSAIQVLDLVHIPQTIDPISPDIVPLVPAHPASYLQVPAEVCSDTYELERKKKP